jgi:hypothetical protein
MIMNISVCQKLPLAIVRCPAVNTENTHISINDIDKLQIAA